MNILVTGGAGYIGSFVATHLLAEGHRVVIIDDLSTGFRENVPAAATFVQADFADFEVLKNLARQQRFDAVIHLAAKSIVADSKRQPAEYYLHNVANGIRLLQFCQETGVSHFVFSSSAAVYGDTSAPFVREDLPPRPLSPYGRSKWMMEKILFDVSAASVMKFVALRFFNVAGASADLKHGPRGRQPTDLMRNVARAAIGLLPSMHVFGRDYPTPDGTCVRDFIHVEDVASAHVLALRYLGHGGSSQVFNVGYGQGASVKQVLETFRAVSGRDFLIEWNERREGDICHSIADIDKIRRALDWTPRFNDIELICKSVFYWEKALLAGTHASSEPLPSTDRHPTPTV